MPPLVLVTGGHHKRVAAVIVGTEATDEDEIDKAGFLLDLSDHGHFGCFARADGPCRDLDAGLGRVTMVEDEQT